jgi:hypothetical protein
MGDEELLRLASHWDTLTESAQVAATAELEKRNLKKELKAEIQAATESPRSEPPSTIERVMLSLFLVGLPSTFVLPRIWPESVRFGLYELIEGVSLCFPVWMIIWLVLRARRIQRMR